MPGWGADIWGVDAWGSQSMRHSLHIPTSAEFPSADVSGSQLADWLNYIEVAATVEFPWISYDPSNSRLLFNSAGELNASEIIVPTSNEWTLEVDIQPINLPSSFADLATSRAFIGAFNTQGYGGGLAISKQGLAIVNTLTGEAYAIPGSMNIIPESNDQYTIRIVVSSGMMLVYITLTSMLPVSGHTLRYTTGALESPSGASDGVLIDIQGGQINGVALGVLAVRFNGQGSLIPIKRPVAVPNPDQNTALNATVKYNGSASYDPQGLSLTYAWTLVGTPPESVFRLAGDNGSTLTNNVLIGGSADSFSVENAPLLQPGDTVVLDGIGTFTVAIGSPAMWAITPTSNGKYVRVSGVWMDDRLAVVEPLPVGASGISWQIYHTASYFDDPSLVATTAVPDNVGIFTVQLVVNDGVLDSLPVQSLTEVTSTVVTFGVIPDVSWIWFHLTDFMNLLEDKETVEKVWSAFAQGAAEVLMKAWQIDYNKSLKDIQTVTQKRWLSYSTILGQDPTATFDWTLPCVLSNVILWTNTTGYTFPLYCRLKVVDTAGTVYDVWSHCSVGQYSSTTLQPWGVLYFDQFPLWDVIRGPYQFSDYTQDRFIAQLAMYDVQFNGCYFGQLIPIDNSIVSIPRLQERIDGATGYLSQYTDFTFLIDQFPIYITPTTQSSTPWPTVTSIELINGFLDPTVTGNPPIPDEWWAEVTYVDNTPTIEDNFGSLVDLTVADFVKRTATGSDYLAAVRGLWYAYFHGPSLHTVQIGTQILLGLPFAEEEGVVLSIDLNFSALAGRMLIQDVQNDTTIRSYLFPLIPNDVNNSVAINKNTGSQIAVGDTVGQFEPLCNGIDVIDYVKDPTWPNDYLGIFKEVEKFFRFIVKANVDVIDQSNLLFAIDFVKKIKPHYTKLLFSLLKSIDPETSSTGLTVSEHQTVIVRKIAVTTADQRNVGGFRWDDNIAGDPLPPPLTGQKDGQTQQAYDRSAENLYIVSVLIEVLSPYTASVPLNHSTVADWGLLNKEGVLGAIDPTVAGTTHILFSVPLPSIGEQIVQIVRLRSDFGLVTGDDLISGYIRTTWFVSDGSTFSYENGIRSDPSSDYAWYTGVFTPVSNLQANVIATWAEVTIPFTGGPALNSSSLISFEQDTGTSADLGAFSLVMTGVQQGLSPPTQTICRGYTITETIQIRSDSGPVFFDQLTAGELILGLVLDDGTQLVQKVTAAYLSSTLGHVSDGTVTGEGPVYLPYTSAKSLQFLYDQPYLFPADRMNVLASWTNRNLRIIYASINVVTPLVCTVPLNHSTTFSLQRLTGVEGEIMTVDPTVAGLTENSSLDLTCDGNQVIFIIRLRADSGSPVLSDLTAGSLVIRIGLNDGSPIQEFDIDYIKFITYGSYTDVADRTTITTPLSADGLIHYDGIWAYDDGGGMDILPFSGPDSELPSPYGPLVGVVHYDTVLPYGTYHRQWWL